MVGFPRLPLVNGDTDDDASIHLHAQVGPSQPLRSAIDKEEEIRRVLSEESHDEWQSTKMNEYFALYQEGKLNTIGETVSDSDSDTYNETEDEMDDEPDYESKAPNKEPNKEFNKEFNKEDSIFTEGKLNGDNLEDVARPVQERYVSNSYDPDYEDRRYRSHNDRNERNGNYNAPGRYGFETSERPIGGPEDDRVDFESISNGPNNKSTETFEPTDTLKSTDTLKKYTLVFVITFVVTIVAFLVGQYIYLPRETPGINYGLNKKIRTVESNIQHLIEVTNTLLSRQDFVESNYDNLVKSMNDKFDLASEKFRTLENGIALQSQQYQDLRLQFGKLKADSAVYTNPEAKLDEINEKLAKLSSVATDLETTKSTILQDFLAALPQHVPVYIKNKRVHFTPELHKYLYAFIENYQSNTTWTHFIEQNTDKLDAYIKSRTGFKTLPKDKFEELLEKRLNENNRKVFEKVNDLMDTVQYTNASILGDKMFLSGMLEVFSKGSIKVNYADYNLGSRILGFLTHLGTDSEKSLARRVFLGWFDYFSGTVSVQLPSQWKYNANNAILDNGSSWACDDGKCSVGIRLFNSVVPTDLIVKSSPENAVRYISIYVKPRNSADATRLVQHMEKIRLGPADEWPKDKYLAKFVKVKDVRVSRGFLKHIKMPLSVINLRVPVKDIYLEFRAEHPMEVNNIKVYGITELDAYKYEEDYTTILDKIIHEDDELDHEDYETYDSEIVLGEDY